MHVYAIKYNTTDMFKHKKERGILNLRKGKREKNGIGREREENKEGERET